MSHAKRARRRHKRAPSGEQRGFGFAASAESRRVPPEKDAIPKVRLPGFEEPDPFTLSINGEKLAEYLKQMGQSWVVALVELLFDLDWRVFFSSYKPTGRPPIHPRIIMGLLAYGTLIGRTSLRELEMLASLDLGAWFVCGGLQPDHSTLGKFLQRHRDILTEDFFAELTTYLVARLKLAPGLAAVDGTVVAAVSSRLSTLKLEAAREAAKEAAAQAGALARSQGPAEAGESTAPATAATPPESDQPAAGAGAPPQPPTSAPATTSSPAVTAALAEAEARAAAASEVVRVAEARAAKAERPGRTAVVPGELDAVIQPLKNGPYQPAYKPSIAVHESGLIVGQAVDPSSETAVVAELREQHRHILGADPVTTFFDAGYHCLEVLQAYADLDILCPAGTLGTDFVKRGRGGLFGKALFVYDEHTDTYRCPGGQTLARKTTKQVDRNGTFANYKTQPGCCAGCALKARCTKANSRSVSRWDGDELKDAMAQVMAQPAARATFKRRAAIVEPVFAFLKERQRLRRFRRRGLVNVRLEFALHCIAFNLGRALSLERRRLVVLLLWGRPEGARWRLMARAVWLQ